MARRWFDDFDALISGIYDAAIDDSQWSSALAAAAVHFGASSATVYTPKTLPNDGGFFFSHNIPAENIERYAARYQFCDPWVSGHHARFGEQAGGFLGDMFVPTNELLKTEFYADHLRSLDITQLCTAVAKSAPHAGDYISFAMFRGRRAPNFGERERRLSERIAPHIQRAFLISSRLNQKQTEHDIHGGMLTASRSSVMLVDAGARILQATDSAVALLDGGVWLQNRFGRLCATTDNARLSKTILDIATPNLAGPYSKLLCLFDGTMERRIHVLVARAGTQFRSKAYVVVGAAANQSAELGSRLLDVYRLTPAEIRLCERLCAGETIAEISESLSVQPATLRSQLKKIFEKTGITKQSDLARLMLDLASL